MNVILKKLLKYFKITETSLKNDITYIGEVIFRSIFMIIVLYIFVYLWSAAYQNSTSINGLTYNQTMWYLVVTETIMMSKYPIANIISDEVKNGTLEYIIGRPYSYLLYHFFDSLGNSLFRLFVNFSIGALLIYFLVGSMPSNIFIIIPTLISILLSLILDYSIGAILGILAFKFEDISGFVIIYQKILFILGGMLIPLEFFPNWLYKLSQILPFNFIIYAPAKLFINFTWNRFVNTAFSQCLWCIILSIILSIFYKINIRKLCINGG